ncbi:MAG: hypothetical protein Q4A42_02935 [Tissierellia bacterium]|nr:hypothetical protein [Tissierellia bacterium]
MNISTPISIQLNPSELIEEIANKVLETLEISKKLDEQELENISDNLSVIRLYGSQDLVKQKIILKMYKLSPERIYKFERHGLKRYQLDGKTVFYSIKEVEEAIKSEAIKARSKT